MFSPINNSISYLPVSTSANDCCEWGLGVAAACTCTVTTNNLLWVGFQRSRLACCRNSQLCWMCLQSQLLLAMTQFNCVIRRSACSTVGRQASFEWQLEYSDCGCLPIHAVAFCMQSSKLVRGCMNWPMATHLEVGGQATVTTEIMEFPI